MKRPFFESPCLVCLCATRDDALCPRCKKQLLKRREMLSFQPLYAERGLCLFPYEIPRLQDLLFLLKDRGYHALCAFFGTLLAEASETFGVSFDVVTYVPRRKVAARYHGFDQARLLALRVGKRIGAPVKKCLVRHGFSRQQHGLPAADRPSNVAGRFRAKGVETGARVLLIDDIVTTGASVSECARALRESGAGDVYVLAIARRKGGE